MSASRARTRQAKRVMRGYMDGISTIIDHASVDDRENRWGLDPWIRIVHDLVDLQVRTTAAVIQGALAGPWWATPAHEGLDPEPVDVGSASFPRIVSASPFTRIGQPNTVIPAASLDLEPDILPAGATQIQILLKDYRFVGANYQGTITLTNASDPKAKPETVEVTVGL
jgi:hypothetical protein